METTKLPTLYKRSNAHGHINQYDVEVEGDKYRTVTGYVGMKMTTSDWTVCLPKNEGKKNGTTAEEQALSEATSLWKKRKDLGFWENIEDCDKKVFYQPMLATDYEKIKTIKFPIYSQPKLDGVRCVVKADGMWTRNGKELLSAPHIYESVKHLFEIYPDLVLDGELYTSSKEVDFNTIISYVRKTKPTQADLEGSKKYIEYWMYDLPVLLADESENFLERYEKLRQFEGIESIKIVPTYELNSTEEIKSKFAEYVGEGYEGQMLRYGDSLYENKRSKNLIKHKEFYDEEFTIISVNEGLGKFVGKAATMSFRTNEGVEFNAGVNGTMEYLEEVWNTRESLIGVPATVKYFEKTTDGSLRFPKVIAIRNYE